MADPMLQRVQARVQGARGGLRLRRLSLFPCSLEAGPRKCAPSDSERLDETASLMACHWIVASNHDKLQPATGYVSLHHQDCLPKPLETQPRIREATGPAYSTLPKAFSGSQHAATVPARAGTSYSGPPSKKHGPQTAPQLKSVT